jgi:hypothetical protein
MKFKYSLRLILFTKRFSKRRILKFVVLELRWDHLKSKGLYLNILKKLYLFNFGFGKN